MTALNEIGRAVVNNMIPAQVRDLLLHLAYVVDTAPTMTERGIAKDLITAIKARRD